MFIYPLTRSSHAAVHRAAPAHPFNLAVERLFDESTDRVFNRTQKDAAVRTPAIDVAETDTIYRVALEMPGAVREQLKVTIEGRRLNVETAAQPGPAVTTDAAAGDKKDAVETPVAAKADAERVLYRERVAAQFARTIVLPAEVDQAGSEAKFENGVLTLTLVKKVPTGARQISIS